MASIKHNTNITGMAFSYICQKEIVYPYKTITSNRATTIQKKIGGVY